MFYNGMPASEFAAHLVWAVLAIGVYVGTLMSIATADIVRGDTRNKRSSREAFAWSTVSYAYLTTLLGAIAWLVLHDVDGVLSV